MIGLYC